MDKNSEVFTQSPSRTRAFQLCPNVVVDNDQYVYVHPAKPEPPPRNTVFAVTGVRTFRDSDKHYRPNYNGGLAPIYEDISQNYFQGFAQGRKDTIGGQKIVYFGNSKETLKKLETFGHGHDYEEINTTPSDQSNNKKDRYTNKSFPKAFKNNLNVLHDIRNNRLRIHRHSEPYSVRYGYVKQDTSKENNKEHVDVTNNNASVDDNPENTGKETSGKPSDAALIRISSLYSYQGHPGTMFMKTPAFDSQLDGVETFDSTRKFRYPKLEPEPPKDQNYWCPAEQKIKMRCFVVCFVCVVVLAVVFVVLVVQGLVTPRGTPPLQSSDRSGIWIGELLGGTLYGNMSVESET